MKAFAFARKRASPSPRQRWPTVRPLGRQVRAQRAEIRHILHGPRVQAKLKIGAPDDAYEREADRIAEEVVRSPSRPPASIEPAASADTPTVRRACRECAGDENIQRLADTRGGAPSVGRQQGLPTITSDAESRLGSLHDGAGRPLPASERVYFEERMGRDFGAVRVHADARAGGLARGLRAQAFTVGRNIVFADGRFAPGTDPGRRLIAHELVHVLQQNPTTAHTERASLAREPRSHAPDPSREPTMLRRQPENCPSDREVEPEHPGTCPEITRDDQESSRFAGFGPSVREVFPFECYVLENLPVGGVEFGTPSALEEIADSLLLNPGVTMHLTGFTDCLGSASTNSSLRTERAFAVEEHLITVLGVDPNLVFVETEGETTYLAANESAVARARNRAVAIYLDMGQSSPAGAPAPAPTPPAAPPGTLSDRDCALAVGRSLGTAWLAGLPDCPCTRPDAATTAWSESTTGIGCFHAGAETCFRQDSGTHAQQCCYDAAGDLITEGGAAGTPDFASSGGPNHQSIDVWTWRQIGWQQYNQYWIPNNDLGCRANPVTARPDCQFYHFLLASRPGTCRA